MFTCAGIIPPIGITLSKDEGIKRIFENINESLKTRKKPLVIFIAGGSASGKTTIAEIIHKEFKNESVLLSQDNYYIGRKYSEENGYNFDQPESLDLNKLNEDVLLLLEGKPIKEPIYSFIEDGGKRVGYKIVNSASIIIVEGLFVLDKKLSSCNGIRVFVRSDCHTRFIRRIIRDSTRTCWDTNEILKYFLEVVEPMHSNYIDKQELSANFILVNHYDPVLEPDKTCCQKEEQVKVRMKNPLPLKILNSFEKISHTGQEDVYFSNSGKSEGEILRIRKEGESLLFTYKASQKEESDVRVKRKVEFSISQAEIDLIQGSFSEKLKVIKSRDIFVFSGLIFSQDYVIIPGKAGEYFLEIRSSNPKKIKALLKKLGLEGANIIKESYFDIFK